MTQGVMLFTPVYGFGAELVLEVANSGAPGRRVGI